LAGRKDGQGVSEGYQLPAVRIKAAAKRSGKGWTKGLGGNRIKSARAEDGGRGSKRRPKDYPLERESKGLRDKEVLILKGCNNCNSSVLDLRFRRTEATTF